MIKSASGDTIIEVLISIAIIGLALSTGYSLSNRSFHIGIGAAERSEALALAQGQVEFLKDAQLSGNILTIQNSSKANNSAFCFDTQPGLTVGTTVYLSTSSNAYKTTCQNINSRYNISVIYNMPPALQNVFNVVVDWPAFGGAGQDQLTLYYKVP